MPKMIINKGLPASGKSTISQGRILADGNTVRINKDLLRKMLHFNKFTVENESITREAARTLAKVFIQAGKNVIIDDTNLHPATMQSWKDLGNELKATIEIVDMTDVPVEECVLRDTGREEQVGGTVIKNMALRYGLKTFAEDSVVLCDIDGTIADIKHRLHFVQKPADAGDDWKKDWKGFFRFMEDDLVREEVRKILIQFYNEGKTVIFMSARPEMYKDITLRWLQEHFLTFAWTVIMRKNGDKRPDTDVKKQMFEEHFPDKKCIHVVIDDRPAIIRLWESMELPVLDVGEGIEF